jgi:hypothetical protein
LCVAAGQVSDPLDAGALLSGLPQVTWFLGDRGHPAKRFRKAQQNKRIRACTPGGKHRKAAVLAAGRQCPRSTALL